MAVTSPTYGCQTWSLSSHMIDRLEMAHKNFLRQLNEKEFLPDRIISTADLHKLHPPTVPMAFVLVRQRASFIGKMILTSQPLSNL
eukprot:363082-Chlamydomonas_euryale.AAC.1